MPHASEQVQVHEQRKGRYLQARSREGLVSVLGPGENIAGSGDIDYCLGSM